MKPLSGAKLALLEELIHANSALYHRVRAAGDEIHGRGGLSAGMREILAGLKRSGPQTLPQIARARSVSRQYIQAVVSRLERLGLVEAGPNPADRRSRLVRLTPVGQRTLETMRGREAQLLRRLPLEISKKELRGAAAVLEKIRAAFERPEWADQVRRPPET